MADLRFHSSLPLEEIESNFKNTDLFSGIMEAMEESLACSKGNATNKTLVRKRSLPEINIRELRSKLKMTQRAFAEILGVSCRTVEAWESGKAHPHQPQKIDVPYSGGQHSGSEAISLMNTAKEMHGQFSLSMHFLFQDY